MASRILPLIFIATAAIAGGCSGCGDTGAAHGPFKGYWSALAEADSSDTGYKYHVRLDFYDTTVCVDGFEHSLGVLSIDEDRAIYKPVTADVIKEVNIISNTEADIKYIQQSSGQLWSGKLLYDPASHTMTFANGHMLKPGADGDTTPVCLPYSIKPTDIAFGHVSDKPNHKEIPGHYTVLQLPDRIYYRNVIADESTEPPFGDVQLRCYYPATDRDINITNEIGLSPLASSYNATIIDCWKIPDAAGLMLIIWTGSPNFQEFTLYRVDDDNKFKDVDYVIGRRCTSVGLDRPDSTEVASLYRAGSRVRAYDPRTRTTRVYDLSGRHIAVK